MSHVPMTQYYGSMANALAKTGIAATDLIYKLATVNIESSEQIGGTMRERCRIDQDQPS